MAEANKYRNPTLSCISSTHLLSPQLLEGHIAKLKQTNVHPCVARQMSGTLTFSTWKAHTHNEYCYSFMKIIGYS